ncbi:MAG: DUF4097 family beta strand repeat protein [Bryobacteraceae bacterium]|nr:DUF4097 family beta strand repeat protein [Bryobacteraceae bacterium]
MKNPRIHNRGLHILLGAIVALAPALAATDRFQEEFHQTYPLSQGGTFALDNVNGDVRISVWDRAEVKVDAVKSASEKERLAELVIDVESSAGRVAVRTKYPKTNWSRGKEGRLSVEYVVTVPRSAKVDKIDLVNGNLTVEGVEGAVKAETVNGTIESVKLGGEVDLSTVNGRIEAALGRGPSTAVKLDTVNGAVRLALPANSGARIKASTVNGSISNDFSLPMVKGRFVGRSLEGEIGSGGADVRINTVNGSISIVKTSEA